MGIQPYFSHDSNARNSDKLINVRMSLGAEGYGIYFMILERLREEENYMSVKDYNMIAFDLRVNSSAVKQLVEDFGLFVFTEDGKYFYSESFLTRMAMKDNESKKKSEAGKKGAQARWGNNKNDKDIANEKGNNSSAIAVPQENIAREEKERKVNESKEKRKENTSSNSSNSFNQKIINAWNEINTIPNIQALNTSTNRYKQLAARRKQYGEDKVLEAIEQIKQSDFLQGKIKDFVISFDWFVKPNNFIKVLEGNYGNKNKTSNTNSNNEDLGGLGDWNLPEQQ